MKSPIEGYDGLYEITQTGQVYSFKSGRYLSLNQRGKYLRVTLWKDNSKKSYGIHRLVAMAFIPNPENKPHINHKDGNPQNNHVLNLEWVTPSENLSHSYRTLGRKSYFQGRSGSLSHIARPVVRLSSDGELVDRFDSATDASKKTGASRRSIGLLCKGSVGGFSYMFEEDYLKALGKWTKEMENNDC